MKRLAVVVVAACSASPRPTVAPVQNVAGPPPADAYDVTAAELGDPGVMDRVHHRARLVRLGRHAMRSTEPGEMSNREDTRRFVLPVLDETSDRVRLVSDDDDARVAMWADRADLAVTVVRETEIAPGVTLEPGADVDVQSVDATGARTVSLRDDAIAVSGVVPARALGTVWLEPAARASTGSLGVVADGVEIRSTPSATAPIVATTSSSLQAFRVAARSGGWIEIDAIVPRARVHGFIHATELEPTNHIFESSSTRGGYSMTAVLTVSIRAGTCLYDQIGGEPVGVNRKTRERYGSEARAGTWGGVYVNTPWDLVVVSYAGNGAGCGKSGGDRSR